MVLQHAVKYHEARDGIRQQDHSQLTYQALLSHCKMFKACCKQYQMAKERGHTNLASITGITSSLHLDAITKVKLCCNKCGFSHPNGKCLAKGQQCYVCGGYNHYTALCQQRRCRQNNKQQRGFKPSKHSYSHGCRSSCSPCRFRHKGHSLHSHSRMPSCSPSCSPTPGTSSRHSSCSKRHSTPHRYYQDAIDVIPADNITTGSQAEGKLYTDHASDGQVAFFTHLTLPAQNGTKTMVVKIDPGTQVNTIPLSRYHTLYPNKLNKSRYPKARSFMPTQCTWISHDGSPKPFLGHFIAEVVHVKESRMYPVRFYVFEDATNPHILLSYGTLERLGIVSFQVPKLEATHSLDQVVIHKTPSGKRKTAKKVTFQDPISETAGSHTCSNPQTAAMARGRPCSPRVKRH